MKKTVFAVSAMLILAGCVGRAEPEGSFLDPVCMPDGSVVFRQLPNDVDQYGQPRASKANCAWNKPAQAR
jgi:uncharacterized lipoprotein NlpE involved in copper resistance